MTKIIVITSGKGGVGKTTTAINLGAAMNHFGKDVLVIDGNLTTPNVGIHLGSPEVPINLNHILNGKADVFVPLGDFNLYTRYSEPNRKIIINNTNISANSIFHVDCIGGPGHC